MNDYISIGELMPKFFTGIETINPNRKIFNVDTGENLDSIFCFKYSDRLIQSDIDVNKVAQFLNNIYGDNWDSVYNLITTGNNLMLDFGNVESETTTHNYEYTDTIADTEKTPAFDVTVAELDRQTDRTLNHKVITDTLTRIKDTKDISKFTIMWDYIQKNWLDDVVFYDVVKFTTLQIHN